MATTWSILARVLLVLTLGVPALANPTCAGNSLKVLGTMNPWNAGRCCPLPAAVVSCAGTPGSAGVVPLHISVAGKSMIEFVNVTGAVRWLWKKTCQPLAQSHLYTLALPVSLCR